MRVSLRRDQAELVLETLIYCMRRFDNQNAVRDQQPAIKLACKLATQRTAEVAAIFEKALSDGPAAV